MRFVGPNILYLFAAAINAGLFSASDELYDVWNLVDVPQIVCGSAGKVVSLVIRAEKESDFATKSAFVRLLRSSGKKTVVAFNITDVANRTVIANTIVDLNPLSRRLEIDQRTVENEDALNIEDTTCEAFWLSDGRSPAEIPETWQDALNDFRIMCETEGFSMKACADVETKLFHGRFISPDVPLRIDGTLCMRILGFWSYIATMPIGHNDIGMEAEVPQSAFEDSERLLIGPRKLKGAGGFYSRQGGFRSSTSSSRIDTPYGHYDASFYSPGSQRLRMVVVLAPVLLDSHMYTRHSYYSSRSEELCDRFRCFASISPQETFHRDDIVDASFELSSVVFPLRVNFWEVSGDDYAPSRICPPKGWCPHCPSNASWTPPLQQDLLFALGDPRAAVDGPFASDTALGIASGSIIFALACCAIARKVCQRSPRQIYSAATLPIPRSASESSPRKSPKLAAD